MFHSLTSEQFDECVRVAHRALHNDSCKMYVADRRRVDRRRFVVWLRMTLLCTNWTHTSISNNRINWANDETFTVIVDVVVRFDHSIRNIHRCALLLSFTNVCRIDYTRVMHLLKWIEHMFDVTNIVNWLSNGDCNCSNVANKRSLCRLFFVFKWIVTISHIFEMNWMNDRTY